MWSKMNPDSLIDKNRALNFAFRKLGLNMIYNLYLNEYPFTYHISILRLGRGELRLYSFAYLGGRGVQNLGKPADIMLACSIIPH